MNYLTILLFMIFSTAIAQETATVAEVGSDTEIIAEPATCDEEIKKKIADIMSRYDETDQLKEAIKLHTQLSVNRIAFALLHAKTAIDNLNKTLTLSESIQKPTADMKADEKMIFETFLNFLYKQDVEERVPTDVTGALDSLFNSLQRYSSDAMSNTNPNLTKAMITSHVISNSDRIMLFTLLTAGGTQQNRQEIESLASQLKELFKIDDRTAFEANMQAQSDAIDRALTALQSSDFDKILNNFQKYVLEEMKGYESTYCDNDELTKLLSIHIGDIYLIKNENCNSCKSFAEILDPTNQSILGEIFRELTLQIDDPLHMAEIKDLGETNCSTFLREFEGIAKYNYIEKLYNKNIPPIEYDKIQSFATIALKSRTIRGTIDGASIDSQVPETFFTTCVLENGAYTQQIYSCLDISEVKTFLDGKFSDTVDTTRCETELTKIKNIDLNDERKLGDKQIMSQNEISQKIDNTNTIIANCQISCLKDCQAILNTMVEGNSSNIEEETVGKNESQLAEYFKDIDSSILTDQGFSASNITEVIDKCFPNAATNTTTTCTPYKKSFEEMLKELEESESRPYFQSDCEEKRTELIAEATIKSVTCTEVQIGTCPKDNCANYEKFFKKTYANVEDDEVLTGEACDEAKQNMKDEFEDLSEVVKTCNYSCTKAAEDTEATERKKYTGEKMPAHIQQLMMQPAPIKAVPKRIRGSGY